MYNSHNRHAVQHDIRTHAESWKQYRVYAIYTRAYVIMKSSAVSSPGEATLTNSAYTDERGKNYFLSFSKPRGIYVKEKRIEYIFWFLRTVLTSVALTWCVNNYGFFSILSLTMFVILVAIILPTQNGKDTNELVNNNPSYGGNNNNADNNNLNYGDSAGGYVFNPADSYDNVGDVNNTSNHLYLPTSKHILPWHSVIHQIGRQTLLDEFRVLCSSNEWKQTRIGILENLENIKLKQNEINNMQNSTATKLSLTRFDLETIERRSRGIIRRIIRQSPCSERLRRQYLHDIDRSNYFKWLLEDGKLEQFIQFLPFSFENTDPLLAGIDVLIPEPFLFEPVIFRLWALKIFSYHVIKRYLILMGKYPEFEETCVVCKEKRVSMSFIGCNHTIVCGRCGREIFYSNEKWGHQCPLCRRDIIGLTDESLERVG